MSEFYILFVSGIVGLFLGFNLNNKILLSQLVCNRLQPERMPTEKSLTPFINFESCKFTEIELNFLRKLIQLKELNFQANNSAFDEFFHQGQSNIQNERIQRNHFLKKLNFKLFLVYGIENGIVRTSNQDDKRKKCYSLTEGLNLKGLSQDIEYKSLKPFCKD